MGLQKYYAKGSNVRFAFKKIKFYVTTRADPVDHVLNWSLIPRSSALRLSVCYKFILWFPADVLQSRENRTREAISSSLTLKCSVMHVATGVRRSAVSWVE